MNMRKKELIVSVIIIIAFVFIGMNFSVMASSLDINGFNFSTSVNDNGLIEVEPGKDEEVVITTTNNTSNANKNSNNTPGELADTGLADVPWLIIAICAVSTVFAYNKIREYKDT